MFGTVVAFDVGVQLAVAEEDVGVDVPALVEVFVDVGTVVEQHLEAVDVALDDGDVDGRVAVAVLAVDRHQLPLADQLADLLAALEHRLVQRRVLAVLPQALPVVHQQPQE